jgi:glyoxylase-like metal-dependent hydrolase (beta-lactamase superfamily II)
VRRVSGFTEVGDRVWVARYEWYDVNVTLVEGEAGLLVVDTQSSLVAGRQVLADVRRVSARPLVAVVNTHDHFDHVLGNAAFLEDGAVPVIAHESTAATVLETAEQAKRSERTASDPRGQEIVDSPVVPPDTTFSSVTAVDLGDRAVELVHPGRGHTGGDLVVRLDDADVLLAGDLVEESGMPAYGDDCFPMEWPLSLDLALNLVGPSTVVVPGHGAPVDRDFVMEQRSAIGIVAETIRDLAGRGVPVGQALESGEWPYPQEDLVHAVRRGYEQLPRAQKRLPLL